MRNTLTVITALVVTASVVCAQEQEKPERKMGAPGGEMRQHMQDRMQGGGMGEHRGRPGGEEGRDRGEMMERMLDNPEMREKLGLSEEAAAKIKDKLYKLQMEMIDLKAEMEKLSLEQAKAMSGKEVDEGDLMDLVEDIGKVRTKIAKIQIQRMMTVRNNIDPEKMEAIRGSMQERMKERMKERQGGEGEGGDKVGRPEGGQRDGSRLEEFRKKRKADGETKAKDAPAMDVK